ncbi:pseudouridine synthase [Candidatus Parcubacteria bacterium]|nr:pseudouridine synthase [Candidatus Parcubacteria bacterium]
MRINKYLSQNGYASRRRADELINEGRVFINGQKAELGSKVSKEDKVTLDGVDQEEKTYMAYFKPTGIVTVGAQDGEKEIKDVLKISDKMFPVGRLDKASHGLIILTNDGRVTQRLLHPTQGHEKEYAVIVNKPITHTFIMEMSRGVDIKGSRTKNAKVRRTSRMSFDIVLTEGKNRQIRRMCTALGYEVKDLQRFRVANIELGKLKAGQFRILKGKELEDFLHLLKIDK